MRQFPTYRKRVFISAKWGVGRVASGNFSDLDQGIPAFLFKPSDLAPEVIGFGLIPADDPNGPLIRAQDDLNQRPTPERCFEALPPPADAVRDDRGAQARRRQRTDAGLE